MDDLEQRGMLDARINVPGIGEVAVINTHMDYEVLENRIGQAEFIAQYVADIEQPLVLMGDFNAEVDEEGILDPLTGMLTDVWPVAGDGSDSFTWPAGLDEPANIRIDLILVSGTFSLQSAELIVDDMTLMAADHFPLVADLDFNGGATPVASPSASPVVM